MFKITFWEHGNIVEYVPEEGADYEEILSNLEAHLREFRSPKPLEIEEEDDG